MRDDKYDVVSIEVEMAVQRLSFLSAIMIAMESDTVVDFDHHEINALGYILNDIKNDLNQINYEYQHVDPRSMTKGAYEQKKTRLRVLMDRLWMSGEGEDVDRAIKRLETQLFEIRSRNKKKGTGAS